MFITKSGKLLSVPKGTYLNSIDVNGHSVKLEGPAYTPEMSSWFYLIKCGPVERVLFAKAGQNYVNPKFTCSGIDFGPATLQTGITSYKVISGSNFSTVPNVTTNTINNQVSAKSTYEIDASGNLISASPVCENVLGYGYPYDVVTLSINEGVTPAHIGLTVESGVITSAYIPQPYFDNCGGGYTDNLAPVATVDASGTTAAAIPTGGTVVNIADETGYGAVIHPVIQFGYFQYLIVVSGGQNYSNPIPCISPYGNNACILPVITSYIEKVPVASSTYFYEEPNIVIEDIKGSGASAVAVLAGVSPTDTILLSGIPIPWETTIQPKIRVGVNLGDQPNYPTLGNNTEENRLHQGVNWVSSNGNLLLTKDGTPISWELPSQTQITRHLYTCTETDCVDNNYIPSTTGLFTLQFNDPYVNTVSGTYLIASANNANLVSLSGPGYPIVISGSDIHYTWGAQLTQIDVGTYLGSGYEGAIATCTNGIIQPIVTSGFITNFNIINPGNSIVNPPIITVYGTKVTGSQVTSILEVPVSPNGDIELSLIMAQSQGQYNLSGIVVADPDSYTGLPATISNSPVATQANVLKSLPSGLIIRGMDITESYAGNSNYTKDSQLVNPSDTNWSQNKTLQVNFPFVRNFTGDRIYGNPPLCVEGPDEYDYYWTLASGDNGNFAASWNPGSEVLLEFYGAEHNFESLQEGDVYCSDNNSTVPVTNFPNYVPTIESANTIWVTGPSSILMAVWMGNDLRGQTSPQRLNSSTPIRLVTPWTVSVTAGNGFGAPYEYMAALCKNAGAANYINIPLPASTNLTSGIVQRTIAFGNPNEKIFVEYSNELWNESFSSNVIVSPLTRLYSQKTHVYANFAGPVLLASKHHDIFEQTWADAGKDTSLIRRVFGSWSISPELTAETLETCQQFNLPVHHIAIAPYCDITEVDTSALTNFYSPIGIAEGKGWPPGAINDVFRRWILESPANTGMWAAQYDVIKNYGQPLRPMYIDIVSTESGNLPQGLLTAYLTYFDGSGNETTVGNSKIGANVGSTYQIELYLLAPPHWASGANVYLQNDFGPITLYSGISRSEYNLVISNWTPQESGRTPPLVNYASGNINYWPSLITYEGGDEVGIPYNVPFRNIILHDCNADPSRGYLTYDWFGAAQNGGAAHAIYFQLYNGPPLWYMAYSPAQLPGSGHANHYAIVDGLDHNGGAYPNVSTAFYGLQRWMNGLPVPSSSPAPVPPAPFISTLTRSFIPKIIRTIHLTS